MNTPSLVPRHSRPAIVLTVLGPFLLVDQIGLTAVRAWAASLAGWPRMLALAVLGYGLYLVAPLAVAAWLFGWRRAAAALGLTSRPWPALAFGVACTTILWLGYALSAPPPAPDELAIAVTRGALLPGIAEELLFRAFLFGFLYRFAGWGFLPAALLSSCVFGLEHWYQGNAAGEALGIVALTGLGGVWWSWLLAEWRWNVWVPIAFHVSMNAAYEAFDVADNALGPVHGIVLRLACIAFSVLGTVLLARRHGGRVVRGRAWLRGGGYAATDLRSAPCPCTRP